MSFSFFSHGQGDVLKHERAVSVTVMATTDIEIFVLFYSCTGVWFNVYLSLTIIRFISMRDTYFRCISSQLTESAARPKVMRESCSFVRPRLSSFRPL